MKHISKIATACLIVLPLTCVGCSMMDMGQDGWVPMKPTPEMQKLEGFVGNWTYTGRQADPPVDGLPWGQAGSYAGSFKERFVLGGAFMESQIEDTNPSGRTSALWMTGYDAKTKTYKADLYISDGARASVTCTLDGTTWTVNGTVTGSEGQEVLTKTVVEYSSDWSSYTATTDVSADDGKTWKNWSKETGKKIE
jgi:hypothetical protein